MRIKYCHQLVFLAILVSPSTASTKPAKNNKPGFRSIFQKETPNPQKEENKAEPENQEAKKGWFSRNPRGESENQQTEQKGEELEESKDKNKEANEKSEAKDKKKTSKGRFGFSREKELNASNKTVVEDPETEKDQSKDTNNTTSTDDETIGSNATQTNTTTPNDMQSKNSNQTQARPSSTSPPTRQSPPFMQSMPHPFQQSNRMIVLQPRHQPFSPGGPMQPPGMRPSTSIIAEALAQVLSTAIRFWVVTSFTKWFADEQIKALKKPVQHFVWERLNDRYCKDSEALQSALKQPPLGVSERTWRGYLKRKARAELREKKKREGKHYAKAAVPSRGAIFNQTVVVLDLNEKDNEMDFAHLEEAVTFIISQHRSKAFGDVEVEVVLLMESPGGGVSNFGLGAAQIVRLSREDGIMTTACVDKIAASGGYMLASQAHKLICAPFAYIGSIGVITQVLNYQKVLEKYGVSPIVLTAGDAKAPLSSYGEVTKSGKQIAQRSLTKIHTAFRELVVQGRPALADSIKEVSDGDVYLGLEAKDRKMVDVLMTSEEYLFEKMQDGDRVLKLYRMPHHIRNRGLHFHPLDFLKHKAELKQWLRNKDIPKLFSRLLQTATFVQFVNHVALKYNAIPLP